MKKRLIIPLFLIIIALAGCGGEFIVITYNLSGIVQDQYSSGIEGAQVTLLSTSHSTYTNSLGKFSISNISEGIYTVRVSKEGYYDITQKIAIQNDVNLSMTFIEVTDSDAASVSGKVEFGEYIQVKSTAKTTLDNLKLKPNGLSDFSLLSHESYDGILIQFEEFVTESEIFELLSNMGFSDYEIYNNGLTKLNISSDPSEVMEELQNNEKVKFAQLNYINRLKRVPNDESYFAQWNLDLINLPNCWEYAKGEDGNIIVAVLDTGVLYNSDLQANILPGWDIADNDSDPTDDVTNPIYASHGTNIASIIGAVTNNSERFAGVGWNIKVMPIKVFYETGGEPLATEADVIAGINKAVEMGADIINLSLGFEAYPDPSDHVIMEAALKNAKNNGVAIFAASGNDSTNKINYPASSSYTFAVGAVDSTGNISSYSNYGSGLDIVAPGGGYDDDPGILGNDEEGYYSEMIGTSQATAHVSAVAGLIYTMGVTDPDEVYNILINSATMNSNYNQYTYGAGILDAEKALNLATNNNSKEITDITIWAATFDSDEWSRIAEAENLDDFGHYAVNGIQANLSGVYIIGFIDTDNDGVIEVGEYFGMTEPNIYNEKEYVEDLNFKIYKVTSESLDKFVTTSINEDGVVFKLKFN